MTDQAEGREKSPEDDFSPRGDFLPGKLAEARVAILGLGLMGGSLALALRGHCAGLLGVDPDPATLTLAEQMGLADRLSPEPAALLRDADLVVLAAPVGAIVSLLGDLPELHPGRAVVLDLGSTKTAIVGAMSALPPRFEPVGGHPMCGKERSSLAEAEEQLYQGATFELTSLAGTTTRARSLVEELVRAMGAHPLWLEAETHDRWVAATSHLPYLVACALAAGTPLEAAPMVGPGFRSTTRLAASPSSVMLDVLATNRANLQEAIGRFRLHLDQVEACLAEVEDRPGELKEVLDHAADRRRQLAGWNILADGPRSDALHDDRPGGSASGGLA
jgi:prephenate dehydrogenase